MSGTLQNMRVLLATRHYFPHIGGIETHVYEVGHRLVDAGVDVTILTSAYSDKLPDVEEVDGMHIRRVRAWLDRGSFYVVPGISHIVTNGSWDVIHCHDIDTLFGAHVMLAAWRVGIPYVVTFHNGYPLGSSSEGASYWQSAIDSLRGVVKRLKWAALRPLFAHATRLIGVSDFVVERFQKQLHLPEKYFTVISNGGDLPKVKATSLPNAKRPLIVSSGRLERFKGHHRIMAALPLVCTHYPDVRLRIVGTGPYEEALWQLARDLGVTNRVHIEAIPAKDRVGMAQVLADASLVTQLSEYEAQCVAALEALSLERPMLVTDIPAFHEFAKQGLVRAIPLSSTVEEVAAAVLHQLREPIVPSHAVIPTWENCVKNLLTLYPMISKDEKKVFARSETSIALSVKKEV